MIRLMPELMKIAVLHSFDSLLFWNDFLLLKRFELWAPLDNDQIFLFDFQLKKGFLSEVMEFKK